MLGVACQPPTPVLGTETRINSPVPVTPIRASEIKIPFSTVENEPGFPVEKQYESKTPGIIVISNAADIDKVRRYISEEAYTRLAHLDFASNFAVIVFQGLKGSLEYAISVQDITLDGNDVFIYAKLEEPAPDMAAGAAVTSPYSLVIAGKEGIKQQDIRYHLIANGIEIATFSLDVP